VQYKYLYMYIYLNIFKHIIFSKLFLEYLLSKSAYSENSLLTSQQPQLFQQAMPQFQIQYPFWHQNMRQLLIIKQQLPYPDGDNYMKYSIDTLGLKNAITKEYEPFYILCDHNKVLITKNGSNICAHCGWFCKKTAADQTILERQCQHQKEYKIYKTKGYIEICGQCGKQFNLW
jgi:hypothetical protein